MVHYIAYLLRPYGRYVVYDRQNEVTCYLFIYAILTGTLSDLSVMFSNGHTALSIAESIEDLCPTCDRSLKSGLPFNVDRRKRGTPPKRLKNLPGQTPIFCSSVDTMMMNGYSDIDLNDAADFSTAKSLSPHRVAESVTTPTIEIKHEPVEYKCQDEIDLPCSSVSNVPHQLPSRKRIRVEELGLETFQCQVVINCRFQLCKKSITRQGQYANLVNHLSRHARLHASKKQYWLVCYIMFLFSEFGTIACLKYLIDIYNTFVPSCPVCNAYYTRRYLAAAHVKEVHPDRPNVDPIDYGLELREEYKALLEVCFPGAEARKKIPNLSTDYRDEEDDDFTTDRLILNSVG
uniref:C2H2-type domain-containing protein n=1 Tax=Heterorhabditis bacteriophora TaxID=37862 RepID=A0A1I7WKA5_HETBA